MDEKLAAGLVNRIFRTLQTQREQKTYLYSSHRKLCKKFISDADKHSGTSIIEQRNIDDRKWAIIWGNWAGMNSDKILPKDLSLKDPRTEKMNEIGFKMFFTDHKNPQLDINIVIRVPRHALIRIVMRSKRDIKTPAQIKRFLSEMAQPLSLSTFEALRKMEKARLELMSQDEPLPEATDPRYKELNLAIGEKLNDLFIIYNGFFMPLQIEFLPFQRRINKKVYIQYMRVLTVKTFMPEEYDSCVRMLARKEALEPAQSAFDYHDVVDAFG
jgi:hypothetical protein